MVNRLFEKRDDVSIVLCGEAGQGIQSVEQILARCLKRAGFHVFATKEYMSRIRGGSNSTEIRVSPKEVYAYVDRIDILVPFHPGAIKHVEGRISSDTVIIGDETLLGDHAQKKGGRFITVPFSKLAEDSGGRIFLNIIAAGVILGLFQVDVNMLTDFLRGFFSKKSKDIIQRNILAIKKGWKIGSQILNLKSKGLVSRKKSQGQDEVLLNGAEAVGLGALAGGCNFLSSYPMSPSTGVMVFLSQQMRDFDLVVEQAEDEISAINMALGASYCGARAMVTTSGGGFALMTEGVSLAGMMEIPVVIHLAQRPGPATGLPTRTEQADLDLVLYAGHGEFPRIIFAPGKIEDAFFLTQKAFNLADKYQIPVFVLTDQYFIDSYMSLPPLDMTKIDIERHIIKTPMGYKRYKLTMDGISPRGIPGFGQGLVGVDSDEHDEEAHITEDLALRAKMVEKRLKKLDLIQKEVLPPEVIGESEYETLLIGWGSTYHLIKEALAKLERKEIAFLHFQQVYPLYPGIERYLERAKNKIIIENNATSQLARLIKLHTGEDIEERILKYNGLAFSVEELMARIEEKLK